MEDTWYLEGIIRTPGSDKDRARLASTASHAMLVGLVSLLIFPSLIVIPLREAQLTLPDVPVGLSC